jgi:hypothetical protein
MLAQGDGNDVTMALAQGNLHPIDVNLVFTDVVIDVVGGDSGLGNMCDHGNSFNIQFAVHLHG